MTIHGDLYYEGKEFETRLKEKKPGELSDDLKTALGMPIGPVSPSQIWLLINSALSNLAGFPFYYVSFHLLFVVVFIFLF